MGSRGGARKACCRLGCDVLQQPEVCQRIRGTSNEFREADSVSRISELLGYSRNPSYLKEPEYPLHYLITLDLFLSQLNKASSDQFSYALSI